MLEILPSSSYSMENCLEVADPATEASFPVVPTAPTPLCRPMRGICTCAGIPLLESLPWAVCNAAITAWVIPAFTLEVFLPPPLPSPFLLFLSSAFFFRLGQSLIILSISGFLRILFHSSIENHLDVSVISTPLHDLTLPNLSFLSCDTFLFPRSRLVRWVGCCAGKMKLICVAR